MSYIYPDDNDQIMGNKIRELFHFRKVDLVLDQSGIEDKVGFYENLVRLQSAIYQLDEYLETVWDVNNQVMSMYWEHIYHSLKSFGYGIEESLDLCQEIKKYQANELVTRQGKDATIFGLHEFYFYKTCDVRLARRLIYEKDMELENWIPFGHWEPFDQITEVHDDVSDIIEDENTYNVNRFVASLRRKGEGPTLRSYKKFLEGHRRSSRATSLPDSWIDNAYQQTIDAMYAGAKLWAKRMKLAQGK